MPKFREFGFLMLYNAFYPAALPVKVKVKPTTLSNITNRPLVPLMQSLFPSEIGMSLNKKYE